MQKNGLSMLKNFQTPTVLLLDTWQEYFLLLKSVKKIEKELNERNTNFGVTLQNWKQRHSYADKFRNDFDSRMKLQYGEAEHAKLILIMKKIVQDIPNEVKISLKKNGELQSCSNLLKTMNSQSKDFINTNNEQFKDIANALTKNKS